MSQARSELTPYRIVVFAASSRTVGRGKRARTVATGYAYMGWTETQHYSEARLSSAGSFLFPGLHAVRRAAMNYLALPETEQVSVRTNQDKRVYNYVKQRDGRIMGYRPDERS